MGLGGSTSGAIHFSGLASGLDTESIIQQLLTIEAQPLTRLQSQQSDLKNRLSLYQQFGGLLTTFSAAGDALDKAAAFSPVSATSSDTTIADLTTSSSSMPGTYALHIDKLAQAHKISSAAKTDTTSALGLSGQFLVNGTAISVTATDTLSQIASRINSADAGVIASVVDGGTGKAYLSLTSATSGAAGGIQMSDLGSGTVLSDLGFQGAATAIRAPITNGALSTGFVDPNAALGPLLNITSIPPGTLQINSIAVSVDLVTDSLTTIAKKINDAGIAGVTASVEQTTENGTTKYHLKIAGDSATPTFTDDHHILENLGVLQATPSHELLKAQDASFTLDGVALSSSSNTVTSVIAGATVTLKKSGDATLDVQRDISAIKTNVTNFINAYNSIQDFVSQNSQFDTSSFASGPLFGDTNVTANMDVVSSKLNGVVKGLEGKLNALSLVGVTLGQDGKLSVDDSQLTNAINNNLPQVRSLFMLVGTPSDPNVQYLSSTAKTKTSPSAGYNVVISQAATKATTTSGSAQTTVSSQTETLTFGGALFGNSTKTIALNAGNDVDATVAQINSNADVNGLMVASKSSDGKLVLTAKAYGASKSFTVSSDLAAGSDNSGIGSTALQATGLNVAGTINGEAATGNGQVLTGDTGDPNVEGLSLLVTATSAGTYGSVTLTRGLGALLRDTVNSLTDAKTGALTEQDNQLQQQIDSLSTDMQTLKDQISTDETSLRQKFTALESALADMQAQQQRLTALLG